jgi:hypothetical protein
MDIVITIILPEPKSAVFIMTRVENRPHKNIRVENTAHIKSKVIFIVFILMYSFLCMV